MARLIQITWITLTFIVMGLILGLPLVVIFYEAFREGMGTFLATLQNPETIDAIQLTVFVTVLVVILNTLFGILAAWLVSRKTFFGKSMIKAVVSLPFSISPVIVGLLFILLFGRSGFLSSLLERFDLQIVFAVPGVVLGTLFVTLPLVFNELLPLMEAQGGEEELASKSLGANGIQTFFWVTLPNIKWALLYGVILCTARSIGEFGAVSILSGHIRGRTTTLTLQIEMFYNEYKMASAFACAALLSLVAVGTLSFKRLMESREAR
jgi:sulfate/thiosulfate transport system permease protein